MVLLSPSQFVINLPALPYLFTITKVVEYAKKKDYTNHQIWLVRHVSWGLWISPQRIFVGCMVGLYQTFVDDENHSRDHVKGRTFFYCGGLAIIICVFIGDYTVSLLTSRQKRINIGRKSYERKQV